MTVETTVKKVTANGNDAATVFSFSPMKIYVTTDIIVVKTNIFGVDNTLSEGTTSTTYSVQAASGSYPSAQGVTGQITYPASGGTPLATGEKITIKREISETQLIDLENQGGYFPDVQETGLDRAAIRHLQQSETSNRSLKAPISDLSDPLDLPPADQRAGKVLGFNSSGDPIATQVTITPVTVGADETNNLLINPDFNIWQRGTVFTTDGYCADRWEFSEGSGTALTVSRQDFTTGQTDVSGEPKHYLRMDRTTTGAFASTLAQKVPDVRTLAGQECTFSFWAKASTSVTITPIFSQFFGAGGSTLVSSNLTNKVLTTSWQRFEMTFTPASISGKTIGSGDDHYVIVLLNMDVGSGNSSWDISNVKWERAPAATTFVPRMPAEELSLASHYYQRGFGYGLNGVCASATEIRLQVPLSPMRIAPTVSLLDNSPSIMTLGTTDRTGTSSAISSSLIGKDGAELTINGFTGMTAGHHAILKNATDVLAFDAEI